MIKKIVHLSDTRGSHNSLDGRDIPRCDILICSGNITFNGYANQLSDFLNWFKKQPADYKLFIGGNRDFCLQNPSAEVQHILWEFSLDNIGRNFYLENSDISIEGLNFYGTPYFLSPVSSVTFSCRNFQDVEKEYAKIPKDTHVLITSHPPYAILDKEDNKHLGSVVLWEAINKLNNLKLHCFGKTYENGIYDTPYCTFSNGNVMGEPYKLLHHPNIFNIEHD